MTLTVTIGGQPVGSPTLSVLEQSVTIQDTLDQRSTCTLNVHDTTGTVHYQRGQPITLTDTFAVTPSNPTGLIFTGYIEDSQELNLSPNPNIISTLACIDQHYLADKRVAQTDYTNWYAGDIVSDLLARYLSAEGVTAAYALRHESTTSDFTHGTLSNTVAAATLSDGDVELAPAGSTFSKNEHTSADWTAAGSVLVGTYYGSDQLTLFPSPTIKLSGTAQAAGTSSAGSTTNSYCYMQVWNSTLAGTAPTVAAGDTLRCFIMIPSTNAQCVGGVDLSFDDGSWLHSYGMRDQQGLISHPATDLSGYAKDQRYFREFHLDQSDDSYVGKAITGAYIALHGTTPGNYAIYVDTLQLFNGSNAVKTTFFNGTLQTSSVALLSGYSNITINVVTSYTTTGTRVSPSYSIAAAGIARTSFIAWNAELIASLTGTVTPLAVGATGMNSLPYVLVESSLDGGATWQTCTNHAPLPGLVAGMNLTGKAIKLRETLNIAGPDPTITPAITSLTVTIEPAYQTAKTDVVSTTNTQAGWNAGTISTSGGNSTLTAQSTGDLTLNGTFSNWVNADLSNQTLFGTGTDGILSGGYAINNSGTNVEAHTKLTWAGAWGAHDFVVEGDVFIDQYGNYGLLYMTSNWATANNTWGYMVDISLISNAYTLTFSHGSNSGSSGSQTVITQVAVNVSAPDWHRIRVAYTQATTTHNISIDDVLYITSTNSAITGAGNVGVRYFNTGVVVNGSTAHSAYFQNFGVVAALAGTWTSPSLSLNSVGTAGHSIIQWNAATPVNSSLIISSSLDGGSTWQTCANGAALPTPIPGTSLVGKLLKLRAQLTVTNANADLLLHGLSVWILGQYSASGSRVSPPLTLSPVGHAGATLVSWNAVVPPNTTLAIDTSLDNATWTQVGTGALGGVPIAGITAQAEALEDTFDSLTTSLYTSISISGGQSATWVWDTSRSRLIAVGGNTALLLYSGYTAQDVDILADLGQADSAGLIWRQVDHRNFYEAFLQDASSPSPNTLVLNKVTGGVRTALQSAPVSFTRGTPHRLRVTMVGGVITVYFDGLVTITYTDLHPLGAGLLGLCNDSLAGGANTAHFYRFRVQPHGDSVVGVNAFTRVRMTSTDPTVTPQLTDLTMSAHDASIQNGAFIPSTTYSVLNGSTNTIAQDLDDLAKQSNYWWRIVNKQLTFQPRNGQLSPWILTQADVCIGQSSLGVETSNALYRNTSWVLGGTDTQVVSQVFTADGITQSWTLDFPVETLNRVTLDGNIMSFGIQGVDTGKQLYYTAGNNTITQDITQTPFLLGQKVAIDYNARTNVVVTAQDLTQIAAQAALDGTSGLVEVAETAPGLDNAGATQLAQSRLIKYSLDGQTLTFTTLRAGLSVGQLLSAFLPVHGITDGEYVISDISTTWKTTGQAGALVLQPFYSVTATSGPLVATWTTFQAGLHK